MMDFVQDTRKKGEGELVKQVANASNPKVTGEWTRLPPASEILGFAAESPEYTYR